MTRDYDARSRLVYEADGKGKETLSIWDGLDRLVQQNLPVDRVVRLETFAESGAQSTDARGTTKFDYGPDRLLSVSGPTEDRAFYLFDALGSITNLTTPSGTLLARYKYDAWGNYRDVTGTAANPFGFTPIEVRRKLREDSERATSSSTASPPTRAWRSPARPAPRCSASTNPTTPGSPPWPIPGKCATASPTGCASA